MNGTYINNLFISDKETGRISCDRFLDISCEFINQYLKSKLIDLPFEINNWIYIFVNEISILQNIVFKRYKEHPSFKSTNEYTLTTLIRKYRDKILAHFEKNSIDGLGMTPEEINKLRNILYNPVELFHLYHAINDRLYECLRLDDEIGLRETFNETVILYTQSHYNKFKAEILPKLNIDEEAFLNRWIEGVSELELYKLNFPKAENPRHIKFMFKIVGNE